MTKIIGTIATVAIATLPLLATSAIAHTPPFTTINGQIVSASTGEFDPSSCHYITVDLQLIQSKQTLFSTKAQAGVGRTCRYTFLVKNTDEGGEVVRVVATTHHSSASSSQFRTGSSSITVPLVRLKSLI